MQVYEVNLAMASSAVEDLQTVIADQESEIQQLFGDLRRTAQGMDELSDSSGLSEQAADDLRWTVDSVRTELAEARQILRGVVDRVREAAISLRQSG